MAARRPRLERAGRCSPSPTWPGAPSPTGSCTRSSRAAAAPGTRSGARRSTSRPQTELDEIVAARAGRRRRISTSSTRSSSTRSRATARRGRRPARRRAGRSPALDAFLRALAGARPGAACRADATPRSSSGSPAGSTRASKRCGRRAGSSACTSTSAPATTPSRSSCGCTPSDDPTLSLPVSLLRRGGEGFAFVRDGDPYATSTSSSTSSRRCFAEHGIEFDDDEAELDTEADDRLSAQAPMPLLESARRAGAAPVGLGARAAPASGRT